VRTSAVLTCRCPVVSLVSNVIWVRPDGAAVAGAAGDGVATGAGVVVTVGVRHDSEVASATQTRERAPAVIDRIGVVDTVERRRFRGVSRLSAASSQAMAAS
jgi:hypothetical protein